MSILSFENAMGLACDRPHLLLGNGFSMALFPQIFSYSALLDRAELELLEGGREAFKVLQTNDFETVIRASLDADRLISIFDESNPLRTQLLTLADGLRDRLISAIAGSHPALPRDISRAQYQNCRRFLSRFHRRYTLNYDLLLYWTFMHWESGDTRLECDDGFRDSPWEEDADYVSWVDHHSATILYLHGAVHLFDAGHELIKYTWVRTSLSLMQQIRQALEEERYPLFVAEGTSQEKFAKISHSAYLHRAFRSFSSIEGDLFVYGHSLKANDQHILSAIVDGKIRKLFVSLYGDPDSTGNREIRTNAEALAGLRRARFPLDIYFYDAESAHVWN